MQIIKLTLECPDNFDGEPATTVVQMSRREDDEVPVDVFATLLVKAFVNAPVITFPWQELLAATIVKSAEYYDDNWPEGFNSLLLACEEFLEKRERKPAGEKVDATP